MLNLLHPTTLLVSQQGNRGGKENKAVQDKEQAMLRFVHGLAEKDLGSRVHAKTLACLSKNLILLIPAGI